MPTHFLSTVDECGLHSSKRSFTHLHTGLTQPASRWREEKLDSTLRKRSLQLSRVHLLTRSALKLGLKIKTRFSNERLTKLEQKMDELNQTVKSLQTKVSYIETDVGAVKGVQKSFEEDCSHMKENAKFIDETITELQESANKRKADINECRKQILYLKAYSRRENLKFEGIPDSFETLAQKSAPAEDTRKVLVNFIEDALGIEDAKGIEFQRVHRMGKPRTSSGNGSRTVIARFLRYSDKESVFKCSRKLKDTNFKMFENIPKELHELRKMQMDKLKKAKKDGKRAYFSKSEPDKLFIDGKYVRFNRHFLLISVCFIRNSTGVRK